MGKITQLTAEQEALMSTVRQEWLDRIFALAPLDLEKATEGLTWMYKLAGLTPPRVLNVDSPLACQIAASLLIHLGDRVNDQVVEQVSRQVVDQIWDQLVHQVRNQVSRQVVDQIWDQLVHQVGHQVRDQLVHQVGHQVRDQVTGNIQYTYPLWAATIGQTDWAASSDFYSRIGVASDHLNSSRMRDYLQSGVWYCIALQGVAIVCGAPLMCKRDAEGRLHAEDGPAMAWPDGWAMWMWHGVRVPEKLILHPETYTREDYLKEKNAEVRRAVQERLGDSFPKLLDLIEVDRQKVGTGVHAKEAALLRTREPDPVAGVYIQYVNVLCHSTEREYMLCVPDSIKDAWEAVAWTFGKTKEEYDPLVEA